MVPTADQLAKRVAPHAVNGRIRMVRVVARLIGLRTAHYVARNLACEGVAPGMPPVRRLEEN